MSDALPSPETSGDPKVYESFFERLPEDLQTDEAVKALDALVESDIRLSTGFFSSEGKIESPINASDEPNIPFLNKIMDELDRKGFNMASFYPEPQEAVVSVVCLRLKELLNPDDLGGWTVDSIMDYYILHSPESQSRFWRKAYGSYLLRGDMEKEWENFLQGGNGDE